MEQGVERPKSLESKKLRRSFLKEMEHGMATIGTVKARVQCACPELIHAQKRPETALGLYLVVLSTRHQQEVNAKAELSVT